MQHYRYETHRMPNPQLPFIFHPRFERTTPTTAANWHENIEILECLEGSGYIRLGAQSISVTPGDLVVVNSNTLHSFGTDHRLVYRCLIIDNRFFLSNGIPITNLYFETTPKSTPLHSLLEAVFQCHKNLDPHQYTDVLSLRTRILELTELLCRFHTTARPDIPSNSHVRKAMTYLRSHLREPYSLDVLASYVGVSKYHLARQFKLFTGSTPVQTLNLIRCAEARRLILEGAAISEAARACGFENLSWFTRTFQKHFGYLPSKIKDKSQ